MKIERFEDIETWKEARRLTQLVYRLTSKTTFQRDFGLTSQTQRAAVSVMNNIVEGFADGSTASFRQFLGYARRSSSEVQCCLYVARDLNYISEREFTETYRQAEAVRRMITAFMKYLGAFKGGRRTHQPTNPVTHQLTNPQTHQPLSVISHV